MSQKNNTLSPPSLAQYFDAPETYVGCFGWLCGYSADAAFLDTAVERFTRLTHSQRAHEGRIFLAAVLDPGTPHIFPIAAPGVAHLPISDFANKPFRLLHAKMALLGFRHQEDSDRWCLRLLISTGNWTRQTVEESLDLAWSLDVTSDELSGANDATRLCCADVKAAWERVKWLENLFDDRLLRTTAHSGVSETQSVIARVEQWVEACAKKARGRPRLLDNRSGSLLSQLPLKIAACSGGVARNYLAMGSGFYESASDKKGATVPQRIVAILQKEGLLTQSCEVHLYVNPAACQAVATSIGALREEGFKIWRAASPEIVFGGGSLRTLHAKFLFGTNRRGNSNGCSSPWVYLGSGNLTRPGFTEKMNAHAGNFEVGVVFDPGDLYWRNERNIDPTQVVTNKLPLQRDNPFRDDSDELLPGPQMQLAETFYVAAPIAWLAWCETNGVHELQSAHAVAPTVVVLNSNGEPCQRTPTGFAWHEEQPRMVTIRWTSDGQQHEAAISVVDPHGRIAATKLPKLDIVEAWWQLADFPMPADDDNVDSGDASEEPSADTSPGANRSTQAIDSPIRQMMEFIEDIAAKQTELTEADWPLWCNRLEQTLLQAAQSPAVHAFHRLRLNPLSPLWAESFRPAFAEHAESVAGAGYEATLSRVAQAWGVNELEGFGDAR